MSSITSMAILGVRSFSPEEPSYIQFFSPLTLIVGSNGSGKTTLIESLKYACTGELPPNSKGGAFVNDPKMAGTSEVKAQIRLKFYNVRGEKMICSRSLAVTQKKSTVSQRSIDNTLLRYDPITGESYSITSRCADMDAELPLHLGVPKAILDNVIFCHQEESNWPLSESSVLKKKFDDIFSSKRYAVALDNIKDIKKEVVQEIRIGNVQLDALKDDTIKAKKLRTTLTQLNQQVSAKSETLETTESKIQNLEERKGKLDDIFSEIEMNADQIKQVISQKNFYESTMTSIEDHIQPRSESTEVLQRLLEEHRINQSRVEEKRDAAHAEKSNLERRLKEIQGKLSEKQLMMGKLEAAREEHERKIKLRLKLIKEANDHHDMSLPMEDGVVSEATLGDKIQERASINNQKKQQATDSQNNLLDELQMLKGQLISIDEKKKHSEKSIEQCKKEMKGMEDQMKSYQFSEIEIEAIKKKVSEYEAELQELQSQRNTSNREELAKKKRAVLAIDNEITDLNDEMASLGKESDIRAKLSLKRTDKETKQAALEQLYNGCINDVERLLERKPEIHNIKDELLAYKTKKERQLAELIERRNVANRNAVTTITKLNMARKNLDAKKAEFDKLNDIVSRVARDKDVPKEIKKAEKRIEAFTQSIEQIVGANAIYEKYEDLTKKQSCCPLCDRSFGDEPEQEAFIQKIVTLNQKITARKSSAEDDRKKLIVLKEKLQNVNGAWIKKDSLQRELDKFNIETKALEEENNEATEKYDVASAESSEVDKLKIRADDLLATAHHINRVYNEIKDLEEDISTIEEDLDATGFSRTMSDCQNDLEECADKRKSTQRDIKKLESEIEDSTRKIRNTENKMRDAKEKHSRMEHSRDFRVGLEYRSDDLKEQLQRLEKEIKEFEYGKPEMKRKVEEANKKYSQAVKSWQLIEEKEASKERALSFILERLKDYNVDIQKQEALNNPSKLQSLTSEKEELKNSAKDIQAAISHVDDMITVIEKDEAERRGTERDLQDQIKYRKMKQDLHNCLVELDKLQEQHENYDTDKLARAMEKTTREISDLRDKRGTVRGEIDEIRNQIRRYEADLSTDYSNVDGRYGKTFIEVKTNELAISDLEKYSKALQDAIMKYHSLKMEDLNKTIRDLWVNTYRGGDIDYIAIRADNEGTAVNRQFNYRVVMIQNGNELVMRGRCSAGQKVLAAIIIRLALAETFCINCGIFTLDEPTTNLDRENIESLAENLSNIIKSRSQQSNFQFVIITHDEEFVEYLSRSEILGKYYRVAKNTGQHSVIHVQDEKDRAIIESE